MKYKINLLTTRKEKPLDRVIYFALNYLRYILIITQIVVIGVFFYRFKVDQEIIDLQDSIDQKKEIIQVSQPLIKEAKTSAFKLSQVATIVSKQNHMLSSVDYLLSIFPQKFFLRKLSFSDNGNITMFGISQDLESIKAFTNRAKTEGKYKTVNLVNIKKTDAGLEFEFSLQDYKI